MTQFVERGSPEWERMWSLMGGDRAEQCPETGEVWQYMGTERVAKRLLEFPGELVHHFRHRNHPEDGKRRMRSIPASTVLSWRA